MRLGTYGSSATGPWRAAAFLDEGRTLVDLAQAWSALPPDLRAQAGPDAEDSQETAAASDPRAWLTPQGQQRARRLLAWVQSPAGAAHRVARDRQVIGPPLPQPGKFIAIGRNYMNHVKEGQELWAARGRKVELPTFPAAFAKFSSSLVGPHADIVLPTGVRAVDYEIELAFVIGRRAFRVTEEEALSHVAGYTICNDIGARELQRLEMESQIGITLSKNFPTFAPTGPWIVTADEIADPQNLTLELTVNGQQRQKASTADMIFSVARIIAYWSQIGLEPGDMITTGTPSGVALARPDPENYYLKEGDIVQAEISGIGALRNPVRALAAMPPNL